MSVEKEKVGPQELLSESLTATREKDVLIIQTLKDICINKTKSQQSSPPTPPPPTSAPLAPPHP